MNSIIRSLGREPVRVRIYTVAVAIMAFLVYRGWVTGNDLPYLEAALTAVLAIPATESARSAVVPAKKLSQPNVARAPGSVPVVASDTVIDAPPAGYQYADGLTDDDTPS